MTPIKGPADYVHEKKNHFVLNLIFFNVIWSKTENELSVKMVELLRFILSRTEIYFHSCIKISKSIYFDVFLSRLLFVDLVPWDLMIHTQLFFRPSCVHWYHCKSNYFSSSIWMTKVPFKFLCLLFCIFLPWVETSSSAVLLCTSPVPPF